MKWTLQRLEIKDFKGVKHFIFEPRGQNATISGPNGAGKSSIADALAWLLTGKDAAGNAQFPIKPTKPGTDELVTCTKPTVEAVFGTGDAIPGYCAMPVITLKRVHVEKWVKPRGKREAELSGYETKFYIDEIEKKAGEYADFIGDLVREDVFRYCTSITHFITGIDIKVRRRMLVEMAGVTDADVPGFEQVEKILAGRPIEGVLKKYQEDGKALAKKLDELKGMIAGAEATKPGEADCIPPAGPSYAELTANLKTLQQRRSEVLAGDNSEIREQIAELEDHKHQKLAIIRNKAAAAESQRLKLKNQIGDKEIYLSRGTAEIEQLRREDERLVEERLQVESEGKIHAEVSKSTGMTCPTCGQTLGDEGNAAELKKRRLESAKSGIERCTKRWYEIKERRGEIVLRNNALHESVALLESEIKQLREQLDGIVDPEPSDTSAIDAEIEQLNGKMAAARPDAPKIDAEIEKVAEQIKAHDAAAATRSQAFKIDQQIAGYKQQQKEAGRDADEADRIVALLQEFIAEKMRMTEAAVNEHFAPCRWRMFEKLGNVTFRDDCELMIPSASGALVEYSKAGSRGEQMAAGLSVVKALSQHFGVSLPLFLDNAESLTLPVPEMGCQLIRMEAVNLKDGVELHVDIDAAKEVAV